MSSSTGPPSPPKPAAGATSAPKIIRKKGFTPPDSPSSSSPSPPPAPKKGKRKSKEEEFQESLRTFNRRSFGFLTVVSLVAAIAPNRPGFVARTDEEREIIAISKLDAELKEAYDENMGVWCEDVWTDFLDDPEVVSECSLYGFNIETTSPIKSDLSMGPLTPYRLENLDCMPVGDLSVDMELPSAVRAILDLDTGLLGYTTGPVNVNATGEEIMIEIEGKGMVNTVGNATTDIIDVGGLRVGQLVFVSATSDLVPSFSPPGFVPYKESSLRPAVTTAAASLPVFSSPQSPKILTSQSVVQEPAIGKTSKFGKQVAEKIKTFAKERGLDEVEPKIPPGFVPYREPTLHPNPTSFPAFSPPFNEIGTNPAPKTIVGQRVAEKIRRKKGNYPPPTELELNNNHVALSSTVDGEALLQPSVVVLAEDRVPSISGETTIGQRIWQAISGVTQAAPIIGQPTPIEKNAKSKQTRRQRPVKPKRPIYIPKDSRDPKKKGSIPQQVASNILDDRLKKILEEIEHYEFGFNGKFMGMRKWHQYFTEDSFFKRIYTPLYNLWVNLTKALRYGTEFAHIVFSDFFSIFETFGASFKTDAKVGTIQLWPIYRLIGGTGSVILLLNFFLLMPLQIVLRYWGFAMQILIDMYDYEPGASKKPKRIFWDIVYNTFITTLRFVPASFIHLYNWIADTVMNTHGFTFYIGDDTWGENYNTVLLGDGEQIRRGVPASWNEPTEYGMDTDALLHAVIIPFGQLGRRIFYLVREFNSSNIFIVPDEVWNIQAPPHRYLAMDDAIRNNHTGRPLFSSRIRKRVVEKQIRLDKMKRQTIENEPTEYGLDTDLIIDIATSISSVTSDAFGERWLDRKLEEYGSPTPEEIGHHIWDTSVRYLKRWFGSRNSSSRGTTVQTHLAHLNELVEEMSENVCNHELLPPYLDATKDIMGDVLELSCGGGSTRSINRRQFDENMTHAMVSLIEEDGWVYMDPSHFAYANPEEDVTLEWLLRPFSPDRYTRRQYESAISNQLAFPSRNATHRELFGYNPRRTRRRYRKKK